MSGLYQTSSDASVVGGPRSLYQQALHTAGVSIPDRHRKPAGRGRVLILAALGIAILSMVVHLVSSLGGADGAAFRCFALHGAAALRACEEVIAADSPPEIRAEAYYNRGVELDHLGRPAEAALAYEHAVRLKPDYAAAYTNMGIALANLGRWDDATRAYRVAIREQPEFADAHYNLGLALAGLRRWAEALEAFGEAARLNPADAAALYNMGLTLNRLGRNAEAVQAYRAAVDVRPGYADAWGNLGMTAYRLGRRSDSLEAFERARSLVPTYFDDRPAQRRAWEQSRQEPPIMREQRRPELVGQVAGD